MIYRLKDEHPLHDKLEKIFSLMDELGVSFHINSGSLHVREKDFHKDIYFRTCGEHPGFDGVSELPPMFDYDLIYRKDE